MGGLILFCAQLTADQASGAHTQTKTNGLNDGHDRIYCANSGSSGFVDLGNKVSVSRVIDHGDQHAHGGRNSQRRNQLGDGSLHHALVLLFTVCQLFFHDPTSLSVSSGIAFAVCDRKYR